MSEGFRVEKEIRTSKLNIALTTSENQERRQRKAVRRTGVQPMMMMLTREPDTGPDNSSSSQQYAKTMQIYASTCCEFDQFYSERSIQY